MSSALIDFAIGQATGREHHRPWTPDEDAYLSSQIGRLTLAQIGEAIGRSENAVKVRQVRKQLPSASKRPGRYTGHQAGHILGLDIHAVCALHRRGILRFDVLPGEKGILSIRRVSLWVWAVNPEHWIYILPARVRDVRLRRLIELRAARWDDEWWTTGQVERYYGLAGSTTVTAAIHRGRIPARRWGNWWIKRSDALAHPFRTGKGMTTGYDWSVRGDEFLLRAHDEWGLTYAAIARLMKWPEKRVTYRYYCLTGGPA